MALMSLAQLVDRLEELGVTMEETEATAEQMHGDVALIVCDTTHRRGAIYLRVTADRLHHHEALRRTVGLVERLWTLGPDYDDWDADGPLYRLALHPTPPERQLPPDPFD